MVVERTPLRLADRIAALDEATRAYPQFRGERTDVIDLAAGDPSFATPSAIARAGIDAIERNQTKYTETRGTPELRAAVRAKFERQNGLRYADAQVIVGVGSKQVLASALLATLHAGDEVVLLAPHYGVFAQMIALADGRPVVVHARPGRAFRIDPDDIVAALTPKTAWVILNNPVNPTGVVYTRPELESIVAAVMAHPRAGILSDEIYEQLTYGETRSISPATLGDEVASRTLTVNGVSKAYSMTGWRIGFGGGPSRLISAMSRIQAATTSSASSISQAAALEALAGPQDEVERLRRRYAGLCDIAVRGLAAAPHLEPLVPEGGLYVLAECGRALGLRAPDGAPMDDDVALVEYIDRAAGVRAMPGSVFGIAGWLRISFAVEEATLQAALDRIGTALGALA